MPFHLHSQDSDVLNLGTGSFSWWHINGPGCKASYDGLTEPEISRPVRPSNVTGCILEYEVIEVLHAGTQCLLAVTDLRFKDHRITQMLPVFFQTSVFRFSSSQSSVEFV